MTGEATGQVSVEVTADAFRRAMGRFASGVTVLTAPGGSHVHAMTASAVASVSLEPLLVLACVERDARFHEAIVEAGVWGVSVLPASMRGVAEWLSTRGRPLHGQLDQVPHRPGPVTGVALLEGALSTMECRTTGVHEAGDHSIVVGEVVGVSAGEVSESALLYYRGRYEVLA